MAVFRCLESHAPAEGHYRAFARPAKELRCEVPDCQRLAVIWLDPEECREYALGTRIFWERSSFSSARLDGRAIEHLDDPARLPAPAQRRAWRAAGRR